MRERERERERERLMSLILFMVLLIHDNLINYIIISHITDGVCHIVCYV